MRICLTIAAVMLAWGICSADARADVYAAGFFSGTIQRFDDVTNAQTTFATIAGNPGLSGIAYDVNNNRFYVSALNHGGVYSLDGTSGQILGFAQLGIGPGGLTVGPDGNVYISNFTANNVLVSDANFVNPPTSITVPVAGVTSGVGFGPNGTLYIATPGTGVFQYDGNSVTGFTGNGAASAQIAANATSVIIGHGIGQLDSAFRFDLNGNLLNTFDITAAMMAGAPAGSSVGFSPSGIAFDADGNVIIGVLGRSNPGDAGGEFGGIFRFDLNGNLLETIAVGTSAFSSIAYVNAVPEPSSLVILTGLAIGGLAWRRRR